MNPTAEPMLVPTRPEFAVALEREPLQAAAHVEHGLAIGLQREADIGADQMVGALVAGNHARDRDRAWRDAAP